MIITFPLALTFALCAVAVLGHGDKEDAVKTAPLLADAESVVSLEGTPTYDQLKDLADRVSVLYKSMNKGKISAHKSFPVVSLLNEYLNPSNKGVQIDNLSALLGLAEPMHQKAGNAMVAVYNLLSNLTVRCPKAVDDIKGITEADKKALQSILDFHTQYAQKLKDMAAKEGARYKGIEKLYGDQMETIEVPSKDNPEKKEKKKVSKAEQARHAFVCEKVEDADKMLVAVLRMVVNATELSDECKALYPLRADIFAKLSILLTRLKGASMKTMKTPLFDLTKKVIETADNTASSYFPLYSSPLFWTLASVVAVILIGIGASVLIFAA